MSSNSKIVEHSTLSDFLSTATTSAGDTGRLNLVLGPLMEVWTKEMVDGKEFVKDKEKPDGKTRIFITVWENDSLRLLFTKFGAGQCQLSSPLPPSHLETLAVPLLRPLVSHLLSLPIFSSSSSSLTGPSLLRTLAGCRPLTMPFLQLWPVPHSPTPGFDIHACSLRSPPYLGKVTLPDRHSVSLVDFSQISPKAFDHLARLVIGFISNHPSATSTLTLEEAKEKAKSMTPMWIYQGPLDADDSTTEPVPLGFCHLGRPTPKTIAIRGVMVAEEARGKGIAERMVANVAKTYLVDARPQEFDPSFQSPPPKPDPTTEFGKKEEVCLFVEVTNETARRLYKRIGFEESEDRWGNWNLEGVESGSW
ncbi:hypothetical protein JCM3765_006499 [Sporobolomyces pararoseus]